MDQVLIVFLLNYQTTSVNRISIKEATVISIRQVKAARALLAWSQSDLAKASGISEPTIARLESNDGPIGGRPGTGVKIAQTLEAAGVIFVDENGEGAGVRLRKARK